MNKEDLLEIQKEIDRFQIILNDALLRSEENKGYISSYDNKLTNVGEISGTKQSGALKRSALDLKRFLTEKLSK